MNENHKQRLADEDVRNWPPLLRDVRQPLEAMPEELLHTLINATAAVAKSRREARFARLRPYLLTAASLILASGLAIYFWQAASASGVDILFFRGVGAIGDLQFDAQHKPSRLPNGRTVTLETGARMLLPVGGGQLEVQGPARFQLTGTVPLQLQLHSGVFTIMSSNQGAGPAWILFQGGKEYAPLGTALKLSVLPNDSAELVLVHGRIRISSATGEREFVAGSLLRLGSDNLSLVRSARLSAAQLQQAGQELERLRAERSGAIGLDGAVDFSSPEAIRRHYGSLQQIVLKDGRSYTGYALSSPGRISIHTVFGIVQVPTAELAERREI
ncbi:MAG: hypothetical protein K1X75_01760 [Leptospirales bacterium]|nr:hypothetical protein [Leptospirales bacterium]